MPMGLPPSRQRILHGLMGIRHFIVHNHANIHVELVNLLLPDVFLGISMVKNELSVGAVPRTPLGELTALPRSPS